MLINWSTVNVKSIHAKKNIEQKVIFLKNDKNGGAVKNLSSIVAFDATY